MGQKANLITIRPSKKSLSLTSYNTKIFIFLHNFLNLLKNLFNKKNVIVDTILNTVNNQFFLSLQLFYKSTKTSFYKKKGHILKNFDKKQFLINSKLLKIFYPLYLKLRCNIIIFSFINLNKKVNSEIVLFLYTQLKKFINTIFSRRFNLFIDFLKLTSLLITDQIFLSQYLKILSSIFRVLQKKSHSRFLFFLKYVFKILIFDIKSLNISSIKQNFTISGIKFVINGKLKGKPRSSSFMIQEGSTKTQTINSNIEFAQTHSYTLLGAFGLRIWLSRKKL